MTQVHYIDLKTIEYQAAWDFQTKLFEGIIERKLENRKLPPETQIQQVSYLLFCEHPHVYTLGRNGAAANMLLDDKTLAEKGASFVKINRGGDITYHGQGQLVGYPLLDLDEFFTDIGRYIRYLEEMVIRTLADYKLSAGRISGQSGVWLDWELPTARKICAVGVHLSRWVTMHGFAFNINTNLDYFNYIIPCGIADKGVTSLARELGHEVNMDEVKIRLLHHFSDLFNVQPITVSVDNA